jgi:hypothetical protein
METDWQHEARMTRSSAEGEMLLGRATLKQLVDAFLEMSPEQQRGVAIRVTGPDWTREYGDEEIRELAARPESRGLFGHWGDAPAGAPV